MVVRFRLFFILLFMLPAFHLGGAGLRHHPLDRSQSYRTFKNISLPFDANQVNSVCQDNQGLVWLGTRRGLYSYNGYDLHEYQDERHLDRNQIYAVVHVNLGREYLCLGTSRGVKWFDLTDECIRSPFPHTEMTKAVRSLAVYGGYLWIGTQDYGLKRMSLSDGKLEDNVLENGKETTIYSLEPAEDGLFVASYECLSRYDGNTGRRRQIKLNNSGRRMVNSLLCDKSNGCVWVGVKGCLYKYDMIKEEVATFLEVPGISLKTLALDADGNLLLGTDAGLLVLDIESKTFTQVAHDSRNTRSLCNNIIYDILCDRNHNVWLATERGVSLAQANTIQHYIHLSELVSSGEGNLFTFIHKDSFGDYWLSGKNGLIHLRNNRNVVWFHTDSEDHPLRHNRVRHVYEDSHHDIWIASDGGVGRYDRMNDRFDYFQIQTQKGDRNANWAYYITEDKSGRIWVASYKGGLFVCDRKNMDVLYHFGEDSGIGNDVYLMQNDEDGHIWASGSNGLVSIDVNTMEVKRHGIYTFNMLYFKGAIWYSLYGKLYRYDISTASNVSVPFSETCNQIYSFIPAGDRIWFTSSEGVFSVDPTANTVSSVSNTSDYYLCGSYDGQYDQIVLGGEDCIVRMPLNRGVVSNRPASVGITSITSNGKLLTPGVDYGGGNPRHGNTVELKRNSNVVIELSSFSYQSEESYYYRFDNEGPWSALGKGQNHISLINLFGGTYELQLSCSNPESDPYAVVTEYSIHVPLPWYLDEKAIIAYLLALVGIVVGIIRQSQIRNRRKYELREKEMTLELSNMKMDFFVNVSHELKTPLSLVIAPVSRLLSETRNAKQRKILQTIHDNALRLNTLIHKILDFKQMEVESEDTLIRSHVEVGALLRDSIGIFSAVIAEKGIKVNFHGLKDAVWASMDRLKIESAIINILSNAIKYVESGEGVIDIEAVVIGDNLHITITDNGCGIDKDDLPLVFVRYFQGKGRKAEGSGIGLYIVKKYIELHGGTISIESDGGTKVKLTMPLAEVSPEVQGSAPEGSEDVQSDASAKILIVDDNKEIVAFLAETLSQHYQCREAYDGKDGLAVMEDFVPDLVIVDEMMPEMDGLTFSRNVRRNYQTAAVPIIMLTAKDDMDTELQSIKAGVDVFMPKPFDIKKLQLQITRLLRKRDSIEKSVRIEAVSRPAFIENHNHRSSDEVFMEKATKAIEDNMGREDFDVSLLADMLSVENKQLYRKLKQLTGYSPVNYIRKLRMSKASILLKEDRFTVAEVMYLVGYSNSSYFSKCFSEEFGMTPKEFAINNRNKEKGQI